MKTFLKFALIILLSLLCSGKAHAQCSAFSYSQVYGQVQTCTAGSAVNQGQILSLNGSNQVVPIPTSSTGGIFGVALQSGSANAQILVLITGQGGVSTDNACTVGQNIIPSTSVTGSGHCTSSPGSTQFVGTATVATAAAGSTQAQVSPLSSGQASSSGGGAPSGPAGGALGGTYPNPNVVGINAGVATNQASQSASAGYTFFVSGGTVYAKNNVTGNIDYSGTDAAVVINSAMGAIAATCGTLFFKNGIYNINSVTQETTASVATIYSTAPYYAFGIPASAATNQDCEWHFIGEQAPQPVAFFSARPVQTSGVIFNVTATAISGAPVNVLIATWWTRPDTTTGVSSQVFFQNFGCRFPTNQRGNETCIYPINAATMEGANLTADFNIAAQSLVPAVPGTIGLVAFITTASGSGNHQAYTNAVGVGWDYCFSFESEHVVGIDDSCYQSNYPFKVGAGFNGDTIGVNYPTTLIHFSDTADINGFVLGPNMLLGSRLDMYDFDWEVTLTGTWTHSATYAVETNVNHTSGHIIYSSANSFNTITNGISPVSQFFTTGGGKFFLENGAAPPSIARSAAFDTFTRPNNGSTWGPAWLCNIQGFTTCPHAVLNSNQATVSAGNNNIASWGEQVFANDQFSRATVSAISSTTATDVIVHAAATAGVGTFYEYVCSTSGGLVTNRGIYKVVTGGAATLLAQTTSASGCVNGNNDVIELDAIDPPGGTSVILIAYYCPSGVCPNTPDVTYTDSSSPILSGQPGISVTSSSGTTVGLTNWSGGNLPLATDKLSIYQRPAIHPTYYTLTNCNPGSVTSPAACGSASSGTVVVPTTTTTYTVNTTAVTALSQITVHPRTDNTGLTGGPTCVAPPTPFIAYESARVAGTSFTFTLPSTAGASCWTYSIVN